MNSELAFVIGMIYIVCGLIYLNIFMLFQIMRRLRNEI